MDRIRVCIGSNDGLTIASSHMGDAQYFCVYDIPLDGDCVFIEKRVNTAQDIEAHASRDKMEQILGIIRDVDVLVARRKSPNFKAIARSTRYQPVVVKEEDIDDALAVIQRAFQEIEVYVDRRRCGELFEDMPEVPTPSAAS